MAYKEQYPSKLLEEAVDAISSLPGVGRRSALRLALHLLKQPQENVHHFTAAIDALRELRTRHKEWFSEFIAENHPVDEAYLADSRKEKPSATTEARELWFVLEPLMRNYPEFIEALRKA